MSFQQPQQTTDSHHYKKSSADSEELGNQQDAVYSRKAQQAAELDDRNEERDQRHGQFDSHRAKTNASDLEERRPGYKKTVTSISESDDKVHEAHSQASQFAGQPQQFGGSSQALGQQQQLYGEDRSRQQIAGDSSRQQIAGDNRQLQQQQQWNNGSAIDSSSRPQQWSGNQAQQGLSQGAIAGSSSQQAQSHLDHHHKKEVNSNASEHHGTGLRDEFKKSDMNSMELDDKKFSRGNELSDEHHLRKAEEAKEERPAYRKSHAASVEVDDRKQQI